MWPDIVFELKSEGVDVGCSGDPVPQPSLEGVRILHF